MNKMCDCREEVEILKRYGQHPGIVSLKGVYEEAGKIYLVLQLLRGGDLLDYMVQKVILQVMKVLFSILIIVSYDLCRSV